MTAKDGSRHRFLSEDFYDFMLNFQGCLSHASGVISLVEMTGGKKLEMCGMKSETLLIIFKPH